MSRKEKIDFYLGKLMSRKLLAFVLDKLDKDHCKKSIVW